MLQRRAVQKSYADAFTTGVKVCTAISAVTFLAAIATYRKGPPIDMRERRNEQLETENERAMKEREAAQDTGEGEAAKEPETADTGMMA
jgi:hypothetical protein